MKTLPILMEKLTLLLAGIVLLAVAGFILVSPAEFYAASAIDVGTDASLLNELKAPAGLLLVTGVLMLAAIWLHGLTRPALWMGCLVYLSYALSRGISMVADGLPADGLVQAAILESLFGLACIATLAFHGRRTGGAA